MPPLQHADSIAEAGRYASYVWGAYGFAAVVLLLMLAGALRVSHKAGRARKDILV